MFFRYNPTPTPEMLALSLHDALPIFARRDTAGIVRYVGPNPDTGEIEGYDFRGRSRRSSRQLTQDQDRKSTRLNSSHANISYAVFCLKKKSAGRDMLPTGARRVVHRH